MLIERISWRMALKHLARLCTRFHRHTVERAVRGLTVQSGSRRRALTPARRRHAEPLAPRVGRCYFAANVLFRQFLHTFTCSPPLVPL